MVEALERSLQEGEADALASAFVRTAAQATTRERMRMLAAAAGGVFTPALDSEMRSRVARALEQLEPSGTAALVAVVDLAEREMAERLSAAQVEHLQAAGCLSVDFLPKMNPAWSTTLLSQPDAAQTGIVAGSMAVTTVGRSVVVALRRWKSQS